MKTFKKWLQSLFLVILFAADPCLMKGNAQDASKGVTITELVEQDGTREKTIHFHGEPPWKSTFFMTLNDLVSPPITLLLGEKMTLKFVIAVTNNNKYSRSTVYFYPDDNKLSILTTALSQDSLWSSLWQREVHEEPYYGDSWNMVNPPYYKYFVATARGDNLMKFITSIVLENPDPNQGGALWLTIKVPVTVIE